MLLNLSRLNLKAPYSVWAGTKPNEFLFRTDYGGLYNISFLESQLIWQEGTYEFGIFPLEPVNSPNDKKLKQTIIAIIEEFFYENPNVLLYQCETGDSRQAMRARLFQRWFDDYSNKDKYLIKMAVIMDEDVENYDAILIKRDHPYLDEVLKQFDQFVSEMKEKPQY